MKEIKSAIRGFLEEKFPVARRQELKESENLLEGGILDSLGVLDVVAFLEGEFGISIADEELTPENFQNIERLAAFVQSKDSSGARPRN